MARKAKRQSSCSGCMTLLAVAFLALFLREQFHLRWWVAILAALGETFECAACGKLKPIRDLAIVDGYLNFESEDLDFVCRDCEAAAEAKGKTYASHPLPEGED